MKLKVRSSDAVYERNANSGINGCKAFGVITFKI